MKTFQSVSLADQVFEQLENDIIFGVYTRGEILTELKLVEKLGVSRTPIREALRRLEQERLIRDSGKGSVVLGITREDLEDIMHIRKHLEGLAAYYAAENATQQDLKDLAHIMDLQQFYFDKWDVERLRHCDDAFHDAIAQMCCRPVIHDTLVPLHRKTRRYRRLAMEDRDRVIHTLREHRQIYEAIVSGQKQLAAELMSAHIANAMEHMTGSVKEDG